MISTYATVRELRATGNSQILVDFRRSLYFDILSFISPVHTDATQMKNTGRTEVHIQAVPHVTHEEAEVPLARHLHGSVERHGHHRHQHIRERQRNHEVVRDNSELPMPHDGNDHEEIATDGGNDDEDHDGGSQRHPDDGGHVFVR